MKRTNLFSLPIIAAATFLSIAGAARTDDATGNRHGAQTSGPEAGMHLEGGSFWFGHPAATDAPVDRVVVVDAEDMKFRPAAITVKKGQTVEFEVVNKGAIRHELVLGDAQEQQDHEKEMEAMPDMKMDDPNGVAVEPGQTGVLRWTFSKAGALEYACHEPGHFAAGMVGTLTVTK